MDEIVRPVVAAKIAAVDLVRKDLLLLVDDDSSDEDIHNCDEGFGVVVKDAAGWNAVACSDDAASRIVRMLFFKNMVNKFQLCVVALDIASKKIIKATSMIIAKVVSCLDAVSTTSRRITTNYNTAQMIKISRDL